MNRSTRALTILAALAALAAAFWYANYLGKFIGCDEGRSFRAALLDGAPPMLDATAELARPGESIFLCRHTHCPEVPTPAGHVYLPAGCHEDLGCFCAPSTSDADKVAARLLDRSPGRARCNLEAKIPSELDEISACPHARCLRHLGE